MFQTGEYVVYGLSGVCLVESITEMAAPGSREKQEYYILNPVRKKGNHVYAPVNGKKVIRAIMTQEEAESYVRSIPEIEPLTILNDKSREETYKQVMKSCDYREWTRIIKTLTLRRDERLDRGKQITAMDSRYWKSAEEYLYTELAMALGMEYDSVGDLMKDKL